MSVLAGEVAEQLGRELADAAAPLVALVPPELAAQLEQALMDQVPVLAGQLCQDTDDALAAQTAADVMALLWPHGDPETVGRADWWRTPLGRMVARAGGHASSDSLTHSTAAAILGLAVGTIGSMVHRGYLERHPDGGVTRASVLARVARQGVAR